jgi:hypothetical protein
LSLERASGWRDRIALTTRGSGNPSPMRVTVCIAAQCSTSLGVHQLGVGPPCSWSPGLLARRCRMPVGSFDERHRGGAHKLSGSAPAPGVSRIVWSWRISVVMQPLSIPISGTPDLGDVLEADLLINFIYAAPANFLKHFRRSGLIDVDPGLVQIWISRGQINVAPRAKGPARTRVVHNSRGVHALN